MESEKFNEESASRVDPVETSHLNEYTRPIRACVGTVDDFKNATSQEIHPFDFMRPSKDADDVDYFGDPAVLRERGMKNAGRFTYAISALNDHSKYSDGYLNCTALVVAGIDKRTGREISIMSHQEPRSILESNHERFVNDLSERLREVKERCLSGSIDAVVAGGNFLKIAEGKYEKEYIASIELLTKQVNRELGFEPSLIVGPKLEPTSKSQSDALFYDTEQRRLYIIRPDNMRGKISNASYRPSTLSQQLDFWKKDQSHGE